jgi:hypothetical protein
VRIVLFGATVEDRTGASIAYHPFAGGMET